MPTLPPIGRIHAASTGDLRTPQRGRSVPIIEKGISKEEEAARAQAERDKAKMGAIVSPATVGSAIKGGAKRRSDAAMPANRSASIVHTTGRRMSLRRGSKFWGPAGTSESKSESRLKPVRGAADRVPAHLLARAKELFMEFDLDGRGVIEAAEVKTVLTVLGQDLQPRDVQMILDTVDRNGSSPVDFRDFLNMLCDVNDMNLFLPKTTDVSCSLSLGNKLASGDAAVVKKGLAPETAMDTSALKKILAEDFDLHDFRLEDVIQGPITYNSLQMFLSGSPASY